MRFYPGQGHCGSVLDTRNTEHEAGITQTHLVYGVFSPPTGMILRGERKPENPEENNVKIFLLALKVEEWKNFICTVSNINSHHEN